MIKTLKKILIEINGEPMSKQKEILAKNLKNWTGSYEQVDDILLAGWKIT